MRGNAHGLVFYVATVWISFAFTEGSVVTFHTKEGCNVTLLCNQKGNVTWLDSDTSQEIEDPRFQTRAFGLFSTLFITDVSRNDGGNITCVGQERNTTISIEVCHDVSNTHECVASVQNGDPCISSFMIGNCKKSCNLCPEPNCTETVLPVIPTTENPQTTSAGSETSPTQVTTDYKSSLPTEDEDKQVLENSGPSRRSGFQGLFVLLSALFSILVIIFPKYNKVANPKTNAPGTEAVLKSLFA